MTTVLPNTKSTYVQGNGNEKKRARLVLGPTPTHVSIPQTCISFGLIRPWWRNQMETFSFPRYWPFVRGIHRSPVNSPNKGQWRGALMFSLICALNKRLSKQSWGWWFETPSRSLWRHCYDSYITLEIEVCPWQCHFLDKCTTWLCPYI